MQSPREGQRSGAFPGGHPKRGLQKACVTTACSGPGQLTTETLSGAEVAARRSQTRGSSPLGRMKTPSKATGEPQGPRLRSQIVLKTPVPHPQSRPAWKGPGVFHGHERPGPALCTPPRTSAAPACAGLESLSARGSPGPPVGPLTSHTGRVLGPAASTALRGRRRGVTGQPREQAPGVTPEARPPAPSPPRQHDGQELVPPRAPVPSPTFLLSGSVTRTPGLRGRGQIRSPPPLPPSYSMCTRRLLTGHRRPPPRDACSFKVYSLMPAQRLMALG